MFIFALLTLFSFVTSTPDYYWRDYDGEIPTDAVPGGLDRNGKTTFIGQVLLNDGDFFGLFDKEALLPTRIYQNLTSLTVSRYGAHTRTKFNKILCSPKKEYFHWLPATSQNLHVVAIGNRVVPGGTEDSALVYIGRVQFKSELIVGKVLGLVIGNAVMRFPYDGGEKTVSSYEVLVFNGTDIPDIVVTL